ncbi:MAG: aspartate ammonia-lyase [Methermicoccaceae archaeon]
MTRIEKDSLGELEVDDDAYYGIQTTRAKKNFPVSGILASREMIEAYAILKKACALANMEVGALDEEKGNAIVKAADEIIEGKFHNQFVVDVFQAGAGTSFNMNVNEVLANRALEILGRRKGEYTFLNPNDDVNMAQSSNDTFPTASHIAVIMVGDLLIEVLDNLAQAFMAKGEEFKHIPKSGRTHLMDAVPVTLGDEFTAYGVAIERAAHRLSQRRDELLEVPIGGTATGTGANTPTGYRESVLKHLSRLTSRPFEPASNSFEALQSRAQLVAFSSALKELALELIRIANDLRLLNSGPTTGLAEIELPPVQPGSSIMPGKVNPVMAECLNMIAFQVVGNDTVVSLASQAGQLELNVMTPVIVHNILSSIRILSSYLPVFQEKCVEGIKANEDRNMAYLEKNPSLATLLNPKIGYAQAAELAKQSLMEGIPVPELAVEKGLITKEEAEEIFNLNKLARSRY